MHLTWKEFAQTGIALINQLEGDDASLDTEYKLRLISALLRTIEPELEPQFVKELADIRARKAEKTELLPLLKRVTYFYGYLVLIALPKGDHSLDDLNEVWRSATR